MIINLANALSVRGFSVLLVTWDAAGAKTFYPLNPKVNWVKLGFKSGFADKLRRIRALANVLRGHEVKTLVGFVMSGDRTVYAAAKLAGVPLIAAERNGPAMYHYRYGTLHRWLTFRFLHLCRRITVQFEDYALGYSASLRSRIVAIPNPVEKSAQIAQPHLPDANGQFTLLAIGRFDPLQKRFEHLIKAFARIASQYPNWQLRLIGDGPDEPRLRAMVAELGITEQVLFEPAMPDVMQAYTSAHLFVIPSLWEGFPNVLAEAMSHGLPAVGYAEADGVRHLIQDGENGWLAPGVDDVGSLSEVLSVAMADHAERQRRGEQARVAMGAFAPDLQYDRWAALIRQCMSEGQ